MKTPEDPIIPQPEDNDDDDDSVTSFATRFFAHTIADDDEAAAARSLAQSVSTALDDLLEVTYETRPHPGLGEPNRIFWFGFGTRSGNYCVRMEALSSNFLLFNTAPLKIPPQKRAAVAEYICRVNNILMLGSLDMDMRDGEVQYKIVQRNADMTAPVVVKLFVTSVAMMNQFFPGVMAVTYTDKSPEQAFHDCREEDNDNEQEESTTHESTTHKAPTSVE